MSILDETLGYAGTNVPSHLSEFLLAEYRLVSLSNEIHRLDHMSYYLDY